MDQSTPLLAVFWHVKTVDIRWIPVMSSWIVPPACSGLITHILDYDWKSLHAFQDIRSKFYVDQSWTPLDRPSNLRQFHQPAMSSSSKACRLD
jgi:hypothetical protein